jgi:predicted DNA-binding transcriptional regulator AlpA
MNAQNTPAILTVKDVQKILQIGSNSAYNLMHSKIFPVIKIGHSFRIPAEPFYYWLNGRKPESPLPRSDSE